MDKNTVERLLELQKLKEAGVLTESEFEEQKKRILEDDQKRASKYSFKADGLFANVRTRWDKLHSLFCLDRKQQEELSTEHLSLFVLLLNLVSFFGLWFLGVDGSLLSSMIALPLFLEALLLFWALRKARNKAVKWVFSLLMIAPLFLLCVVTINLRATNPHVLRELPVMMNAVFLLSLLYALCALLLSPSSGKTTGKVITTLALATILNPAFYGLKLTGGIYPAGSLEGDIVYFAFNRESLEVYCILLISAFWFSSHTIYATLTGETLGNAARSVLEAWKTAFQMVKRHKKACGAVVLALVLVIAGLVVKGQYDTKQAAIAWAEQMKKDSIASVQRQEQEEREAAIRAEKERLAAIEEARQDSIDKAEHQGFVSKYKKVGLIITKVKMTRGTDKDGDATKGIDFTIFNPTDKTIKYVVAVCAPVNGVGDVMGYEKTCRGIGPVAPHNYGSWSFDDVFLDRNDIIDDLRGYFRVIYTNGSSKNIRINDAYVDDFKTSWFD